MDTCRHSCPLPQKKKALTTVRAFILTKANILVPAFVITATAVITAAIAAESAA